MLWVTSALCAVLGFFATRDENRTVDILRAHGVTTQAVVADVPTEITRGGGRDLDWVEVRFTDGQGRPDFAYLNFVHGAPVSTAPGDLVDVVYDPAHPIASVLLVRQLDRGFFSGYGPTELAGIGTVGGVLAWWLRRRRRESAVVPGSPRAATAKPSPLATEPDVYFT